MFNDYGINEKIVFTIGALSITSILTAIGYTAYQTETENKLCLKTDDIIAHQHITKFGDDDLTKTLGTSANKIILDAQNKLAKKLDIDSSQLADIFNALDGLKPENRKILGRDTLVPEPVELSYTHNPFFNSNDTICTKLSYSANDAFAYTNQPEIAAEIVQQWVEDATQHANKIFIPYGAVE